MKTLFRHRRFAAERIKRTEPDGHETGVEKKVRAGLLVNPKMAGKNVWFIRQNILCAQKLLRLLLARGNTRRLAPFPTHFGLKSAKTLVITAVLAGGIYSARLESKHESFMKVGPNIAL